MGSKKADKILPSGDYGHSIRRAQFMQYLLVHFFPSGMSAVCNFCNIFISFPCLKTGLSKGLVTPYSKNGLNFVEIYSFNVFQYWLAVGITMFNT